MRIVEEEQLDFDDVSIMPKRSSLNSRSEVNLFRTFKWIGKSGEQHELTCKPLMVANMGTVGTPKMAKYIVPRGYLIALEKHYKYEYIANVYYDLMGLATTQGKDKFFYTDKIAVSIGLKESLWLLKRLSKEFKINIVNFDIPNGYCPNVMTRLVELRKIFPEAFIIVGTVVTGDIVSDLIMHGANVVRCGICCGSSCLTSMKTGVRRPIISMLNECSDAAHNLKGYIMQDGGIRCPADWCKATIAGGDLCMSGSIFAGTDQALGEIIEKKYLTNELDENGKQVAVTKKFKMYYGMSSDYAQNKHFGGVKSYRTSEGRQKLIPYTGNLDDVLRDYEGGMASMMCYIGAKNFKDIQRHGTFYKVRHQINDVFAKCEDFS